MTLNLPFSLSRDQVFEEVDSEVITVAEVCFDVDSKEDVDFFLGPELRGKCR